MLGSEQDHFSFSIIGLNHSIVFPQHLLTLSGFFPRLKLSMAFRNVAKRDEPGGKAISYNAS